MDFHAIPSLFNDPVKRRLVLFAAALIGLAIVLAVARRLLNWIRRPVSLLPSDASLEIDLAGLDSATPGQTRLTVYHVPVRLAVVVIAPLGRDSDPPKHSQVPELLDHVVPGLAALLN